MDPENGPNLYRCFRCGWTTDVGWDDLAGDERVVAQRITHQCRNPHSPWVRVAQALETVDGELRADEAADPATLRMMADWAAAWVERWRLEANNLERARALEGHPHLFEVGRG